VKPRRWKHARPAARRLPDVDWEQIKLQIRTELDVAELAAADGVSLKGGAGGWRSGRCPFHADGSPSFRADKGGWICHAGCGQGDVFNYLAKRRGLDAAADAWRDVLHEAAELAGVELPSAQAPTLGSLRLGLGSEGARGQGLSPRGLIGISHDTSDAAGINHDARSSALVLEHVADIMRWREIGEQGTAWLAGRGLSERAAQLMGIRDPYAPERWMELVHEADLDGLIGAGLVKPCDPDKKPNTMHLSAELARWSRAHKVNVCALVRAGCGGPGGLAWPLLHPELDAPASWRFKPYEVEQDTPKVFGAYAQPSGHHKLPLGLWPPLWRGQDARPLAVVVCEGEADWLSVVDVALAAGEQDPDGLLAGWHVVPIGITLMSGAAHGLHDAAAELLAAADAVVCMVDVGNALEGEQPTGLRVTRAIMEQWRRGGRASSAGWCPRLLDDDDDVNDLHKRGELSKLLNQTLPAPHTTRFQGRIEKVSA
jgi:hypothetical protein